MNKALFLDRDGTINIDTGYVHKAEDFFLIDGILDLCQKAQEKGYKIIVITNQSGIARGYFSEKEYKKLTDYMCQKFEKNGIVITDVFHCPDLSGPDRKPNPGLFLKAKEKYNLDMEQSVSVGDKERDIQAGIAAGVGRNFLFNDKKENTNPSSKTFEEIKDLL